MATNYTNDQNYQITNDKQSIPLSADGTGTISTVGTAVVGAGTLFRSGGELPMGSWVLDLPNNELRKVVRVESDILAFLDNAFTTDIVPGTTPNIINRTKLNVRQISVAINPTLTNGFINGNPLLAGESFNYTKSGKDNENSTSYVDPIIADATGTVIDVTILR